MRNSTSDQEIKIKNLITSSESFARNYFSGKSISGFVVAKAIRDGVIEHPSKFDCVDCGCKATEYDHRNYNEPLNVVPTCRGCNARRGQAIPLNGFIESMINLNYRPYKYRIHMLRMAKAMNVVISNHDAIPKILTIEIWKSLAPCFLSKKAA
jgi:hypothetical protein